MADRLGPIIRAFVGIDARYHGVVLDIANRLNSADSELWSARYKKVHQDGLVQVQPAEPPPLDTIIRIDRLARPAYPDWVDLAWINSPEFIALEQAGPADYDLATDVEQWLHDGQKEGGWVRGEAIRDYLVANKLLEKQFGLADGLAIQAKGIAVFRKFFSGKIVFLWRSVVRVRDGDWHVPYLCEGGGQVCLSWRWLGGGWSGGSPGLRFAK